MEDKDTSQIASGGAQVTEQPAEKAGKGKKKKRGCLKGCLMVVLVLILLVGGASFMVWRSFNPRPTAIARTLAATPPDKAATQAVNDAINQGGVVKGLGAVVIPLPDEKGKPADEKGSVVVFGINLTGGFIPATTEEEMRQQAMQIIRAAVESNRQEGLDIKYSSCGFYNDGKPVAAMSTSIEAMEAWVDGRISDEEFLGAITIKVHDVGYYMNLAQEYLNASMSGIIRDIILPR